VSCCLYLHAPLFPFIIHILVLFPLEKLNGTDHSEDLDVDGRIIIKLVLGKQGHKVWT
jgi:hypothetical protein